MPIFVNPFFSDRNDTECADTQITLYILRRLDRVVGQINNNDNNDCDKGSCYRTDQSVFLDARTYRLIRDICLIYHIYGFGVHNVLDMICCCHTDRIRYLACHIRILILYRD